MRDIWSCSFMSFRVPGNCLQGKKERLGAGCFFFDCQCRVF
eukprot:UN05678